MNQQAAVLIVSASVGSGHHQAAAAIREVLSKEYDVEVKIADFLVESRRLGKIIKGAYLKTIQVFPEVYDYFYRYTDISRYTALPIKSLLYHTLEQNLLDLIQQNKPDILVFTHPFPCAVAAGLKRKGKIELPVVGVITDYAVHRLWEYPEVDAYVVAYEELRQQMVQHGLVSSRIEPTGIPISPQVCSLKPEKTENHVLIMGGGMGLGPTEEVFASLIPLEEIASLTVICGSNESLYDHLKQNYRQEHVHIYGFRPDVLEIMAKTKILVTKPGALTSSEALALHCPMILMDAIGGQEEENAAYLESAGAALWVREVNQIAPKVRELLHNSAEYNEMCKKCSSLAKPTAAWSAASTIMELIQLKLAKKPL